jgi:hypothetical protein
MFHFYITCRPPEANGMASITSSFRSSEFNSGYRVPRVSIAWEV